MKRSKGMQLGALLAAMLLLSIALVSTVGAQGTNEQTNVVTPGKVMTPDGRYILNESDFDNAVIESGTVKIPNTSSIAERINVTKNVIDQLSAKIKVPANETVATLCDYTADKCSYKVARFVKPSANSAIPAIDGWTEKAWYNPGGGSTTLFEGMWNVPSAPLSQNSTLQTIFYFTALQDYNAPPLHNDILQPVLEWGQYGNYWDISSWYVLNFGQGHSDPINVNVGDSIYGYIQYRTGYLTPWFIYTYDITTNQATSISVSANGVFNQNYVTLEAYRVNNCNQLSGGNDFSNLNIAGRTPSWTPWVNQTALNTCGTLGVNVISPSEVVLKTGRMP